jgi:hypothetical protein
MGPISERCRRRPGTSGHGAQPERAGTDLDYIGESNSGVTWDSNGLSKTATPAFHQEVVSRIVIDAEGQRSTNGWRARNNGDAKRVLARESPQLSS